MAEGTFQIHLSVDTSSSGRAKFRLPEAISDLEFSFLVVKDGGAEAIVKVDAPSEILKKLERREDCRKLTSKQAEQLRASYPVPKLKKKYRLRSQGTAPSTPSEEEGLYELNAEGYPIIDIYQTVRSGFHLIDVPIRNVT